MEKYFQWSVLYLMIVVSIHHIIMVKSSDILECKDHNVTVTDEELATMDKCPQMDGCFLKCMRDALGHLDKLGMLIREKIVKDIERKLVPKDIENLYKKGMEKCLEVYAGTINPKEKDCKSYAQFEACVLKSEDSICYKKTS